MNFTKLITLPLALFGVIYVGTATYLLNTTYVFTENWTLEQVNGESIKTFPNSYIAPLGCDLFAVENGQGLTGIVDDQGVWLAKPTFGGIKPIHANLCSQFLATEPVQYAASLLDRGPPPKSWLIDRNGSVLKALSSANLTWQSAPNTAGYFIESVSGRARDCCKRILDKNGVSLLPIDSAAISNVWKNQVWFRDDEHWNFFDLERRKILLQRPADWQMAGINPEGHSALGQPGHWEIISNDGEPIVEVAVDSLKHTQLKGVWIFRNHSADNDGLEGLITEENQVLLQPQYEMIDSIDNTPLFVAYRNNQTFVLKSWSSTPETLDGMMKFILSDNVNTASDDAIDYVLYFSNDAAAGGIYDIKRDRNVDIKGLYVPDDFWPEFNLIQTLSESRFDEDVFALRSLDGTLRIDGIDELYHHPHTSLFTVRQGVNYGLFDAKKLTPISWRPLEQTFELVGGEKRWHRYPSAGDIRFIKFVSMLFPFFDMSITGNRITSRVASH